MREKVTSFLTKIHYILTKLTAQEDFIASYIITLTDFECNLIFELSYL